MGKKGPSKKTPTATCGPQMSVTMREASTGKKHTNAKSSLKLQHLKNLALWATRDVDVPSLGAFFGHHFAASSEALATPVDPTLFTCQRCESILHPGYNCTIRIEKHKINNRLKRNKNTRHPQNNVVYTCHFCSHRNMKRGTPRNTSQPKVKPHQKSTLQKTNQRASSSDTTIDNIVPNTIAVPSESTANDPSKGKMGILEINETLKVKDNVVTNTIDDPDRGKIGILEMVETLEVKNSSDASNPATPLTKSTLTLLESKMKKRNRSGAKKTVAFSETQNAEKSVNTSNRRKRKSWTSLKEIAKNNNSCNNSRRLVNLTVPFSMQ